MPGNKGQEGFPSFGSRSDQMMVAVGFNPRTYIGQPQCVAERRAKPSASVGPTRSTVAPRREIGFFVLPWVKTHGYLQTSLRDGHCIGLGIGQRTTSLWGGQSIPEITRWSRPLH